VVAITGSNGKTSVKSLIVSILQRAGVTYFNPGNRNNEIGLPLTVIDAPDDADFAVYEMGAGQPGDIAYLTGIVAPDVALVNNVAAAHLERMGSLLGVAETKGAVYDALPASGTAVINADDAFAEYFAERVADRRILRFGLEASADVTVRVGADVAPQGEVPVELHLPGRHNVLNALAAASLALACDVSLAMIAEGLAAAQPVAGRQIAHTLGNGAVLIDDSYNANPGSLAAAIDALAAAGGEAWLVLGDMRELGADAEALHADAGRRARRRHPSPLHAGSAQPARRAGVWRRRPPFRHTQDPGRSAARRSACRRALPGEGFARQRHGQDRHGAAGRRGGETACCLNSRAGCRAWRISSGCSAI